MRLVLTILLLSCSSHLFANSNASTLIERTGCATDDCHISAADFIPPEFEFAWIEDGRLFGSTIYQLNIQLPEDNLMGRNGYWVRAYDPGGNPVGAFVKNASGDEFEPADNSNLLQIQETTMAVIDPDGEDETEFYWKSPAEGALPELIFLQVYTVDGANTGNPSAGRYSEALIELSLPDPDDETPPPAPVEPNEEEAQSFEATGFQTTSSCQWKRASANQVGSLFWLLLFAFLCGLNLGFHLFKIRFEIRR